MGGGTAMTSVGQRGPGLRQEGSAGARGEGGQPGILAAGLQGRSRPHEGAPTPPHPGGGGGTWGWQERREAGERPSGEGGVEGEPPVRPDWPLCSGLLCGQALKKVSVRFNWKQSRLSGPEEST